MANLTVPPEGLDITPAYGSYQVGIVLTTLFSGITTTQVYLYFWNYYDHDKWILKGSVLFLWALDLVNLALIIGGSWNIEVKQWGSIATLETGQLLVMDHTEIEAFVIIVVQLYLIRRVWLFNKKKSWFDMVILCTLPILSFWQLIGDIIYQVFGYGKPLAVLSTPREVGLNISLRAVAAFVDIAVTLYMVRLLSAQRAQGFSRTKQMLSRMLLVVVNTGMFTAVLATVTLILLASRPNDLYYLITELPLCTAYLSCFLANLNSREFIKGPGGVISLTDTTFNATPHPSGSFPLMPSPSRSWPVRGNTSSSGTEEDNWKPRLVNINIHTDQRIISNSTTEDTETRTEAKE